MQTSNKLYKFKEELPLTSGQTLDGFELMVECYGNLNQEKNNAILLNHAFSGSHHAAGEHNGTLGWWDDFVGPNKILDTNKFFIVSANNIGSCFGSSGPISLDKNGKRYNADFPEISVKDWVQAQKLLADKLKIQTWKLVVGGSLGGMQSLQWAIDFPDMVEKVAIIAAAATVDSQNIALNEVEREVIRKDSSFYNGNYYEHGKVPTKGLKAARMLGHITYLSAQNMEQRFGRKLQDQQTKLDDTINFEVENYLQYQGGKFADVFDANSYILLTKVMDGFDPSAEYDNNLVKTFKNISAEMLIISFASDWMFPPARGKEMLKAAIKANKKCSFVEFEGAYGHDSFLYAEDNYPDTISTFLEGKL